jgi:hypothetical protein
VKAGSVATPRDGESVSNPKPPDAPTTERCLKSADCACGNHPKPPPADGTCRLSRTVARDGLRLDVWTCSDPTPRPAQGAFTVGVFKRGEPVTAQSLFPGSADAWSCNTPVWPGHLDLVLFRGGPEEAGRTARAIAEATAEREAQRVRMEQAEAAAAARRATGDLTVMERMALAAEAQRAKEKVRAASKPKTPRRSAPAKGKSIGDQIAAILKAHRFHKTFVAMVVTRRYRFYRVTAADVASGESYFSEAGWYFNAVKPPSSWMNNDPIGPYRTIEYCLKDVFSGNSSEEEDS